MGGSGIDARRADPAAEDHRPPLRRDADEGASFTAGDGADYLVVPSKGGADQPPAWLLNLEAKPEVEIQVGRERQKAGSRVVEPSDPDYARLWKIVNENNGDRYTAYQKETSRPIPVSRHHAALSSGHPPQPDQRGAAGEQAERA